MATGFKNWSKTAASNGTADDNINFVEGQSPSTVNNSARSLMAVMADWRDDNNGTLVTAGSSNAFTLTENQTLGTLTDGDTLVFTTDRANTGAATLEGKAWNKADGSAYASGEILSGARYHVSFHGGDDEWRTIGMQDYASSQITYDNTTSGLTASDVKAALDEIVATITPSGTVAWYAANSPPTGWLECDGSAVSRTTYATLFAAISTTFGVGDGSTTFNLPDLRGEFVRGWDNSKGTDSGRAFGSFQDEAFKAHKHAIKLGHESAGSQDSTGWPNTDSTGPFAKHESSETDGSSSNSSGAGNPLYEEGGDETRPRNYALLPMIKT